MSRPEQRDASTLRHDGRWSLTLALADAGAASNAYRNESCDNSDEYFLHWSSPFFTPRDTHFVLAAPLVARCRQCVHCLRRQWGNFEGDFVFGDTA